VSKTSELLPEPLGPVTTLISPRGNATSTSEEAPRERDRGDHSVRLDAARACGVERHAVIDARAHEGEAPRDVHRVAPVEELARDRRLVVEHRDDARVRARLRLPERGLRRLRADERQAARRERFLGSERRHARGHHTVLLVAEEAVLAGVRVEAAHRDRSAARHAEANEGLGEVTRGTRDAGGGDRVGHGANGEVRRDERDREARPEEHHRHVVVGELRAAREVFRLTDERVARHRDRRLRHRRRDDGGGAAREHRIDRRIERRERDAPRLRVIRVPAHDGRRAATHVHQLHAMRQTVRGETLREIGRIAEQERRRCIVGQRGQRAHRDLGAHARGITGRDRQAVGAHEPTL
jgi:hypothetical protein